MITPEIIGKNLVNARFEFGYTQKELADKLAVSPQNISKWERGVSVPDVITLMQIGEILNKDIKYFLESHLRDVQEAAPIVSSAPIATSAPTVPTAVTYVDSVFSNANWYKQRLREIKRVGIYLTGSIMRYSDFSSLNLEHCKIKDCELFHCSSSDLKMSDVEIKHSFFRFMNAKNMTFSSCKINAAFYKCEIADSDFSAIVFDNCNIESVFENCKFSRIAVKNCKRIRHCTFLNCEMDRMSEQAFRAGGAAIINCTISED